MRVRDGGLGLSLALQPGTLAAFNPSPRPSHLLAPSQPLSSPPDTVAVQNHLALPAGRVPRGKVSPILWEPEASPQTVTPDASASSAGVCMERVGPL